MREKIVIVDDEEYILKTCQRILMGQPYKCITFTSPEKALDSILEIKPAVIVSDQRMPEMDGVTFLQRSSTLLPDSVRIIITGYADIHAAINAINKGNVFRFIKKPWDDVMFKAELETAVKYFKMIQRLKSLDNETAVEALVKRERLQGVLEMAGAVCHEFSQPLQVISGYCDLSAAVDLKKDLQSALKYISCIQQETQKLGDLLTKITSVKKYKTCSYTDNFKIIDLNAASLGSMIDK